MASGVDGGEGFAEDRPIFERQPGESLQAYEAFKHYARQPYVRRGEGGALGGRSLTIAAGELGKSPALLKRWSAAWGWQERAAAYDEEQRRVEREAFREAEREASKRIAERRIAFRDRAWALAELAAGRVEEMLRFPIHEDEEGEDFEGPDGFRRIVIRKPVGDWSLATTANLIRALLQLGVVATDNGEGVLDAELARIDPDSLPDEVVNALADGENPIQALISALRLATQGEGDEDEAGA